MATANATAPHDDRPVTLLSRYLDVLREQGKLSLRGGIQRVLWWIAGILVATGLTLTAIIFVLYGLATEMIPHLGGHVGLSYLVTGLALGVVGILTVGIGRALARRRTAREFRTLTQIAAEAGQQLTTQLAPSTWVRNHPLPSAGAAAVAGFVAGRHYTGNGDGGAPASAATDTTPGPSPIASPTLFGILLAMGMQTAKEVFVPVLAEKLGEQFHRETPPETPEQLS